MPWRQHGGWSLVLGLMALSMSVLVVLPPAATWAWAGPAAIGTWEQMGLVAERPYSLTTPTSGALFALTQTTTYRSDDAGLTWRPVPGPDPQSYGFPDLHDHTRLYAYQTITRDGDERRHVMRSPDEGATWDSIMELPPLHNLHWQSPSWELYQSPAAPGLIYLIASATLMRRSDDGGDTWITLTPPAPPSPGERVSCDPTLKIHVHPTVPDQIFRITNCTLKASHDSASEMPDQTDLSMDRGQTWTTVARSSERGLPGVTPYRMEQLVGCGLESDRVYRRNSPASTSRGPSQLGATLDRSDDRGQSWTTVRDGEQGQAEYIDRIVCDPTAPNRIVLQRQDKVGGTNTGPKTLRMSEDGGMTAPIDLGLPSDLSLSDMVIGIDGRYLFAATTKGVWRLQIAD